MSNKLKKIFLCAIFFILYACNTNIKNDLSCEETILRGPIDLYICKTRMDWEKLKGDRFRCPGYDSSSTCITLSILKECCQLEFFPGDTIPPEASEKVILKKNGIEKEVKGPDDLIGCVNISSPEHAIEYLRFFSSFENVHLFEEQKLEIYPNEGIKDCIGVCMDEKKWKKLGLHHPIIKTEINGFDVIRFIIKPIPYRFFPTIYKERVFVNNIGEVELLEEEFITSCEKYTEGLFFPTYL